MMKFKGTVFFILDLLKLFGNIKQNVSQNVQACLINAIAVEDFESKRRISQNMDFIDVLVFCKYLL
jgi:hypothetical protein